MSGTRTKSIAPPLSSTEHAIPFHGVPMSDLEKTPQSFYPPTVAVPAQKTDAELRSETTNALPSEDSILRNDQDERRNDPHYKQWMKDEPVAATAVEEAENKDAFDAREAEQAEIARSHRPNMND